MDTQRFSTGNPVFDGLVTVLTGTAGNFVVEHVGALHRELLAAYELEPVRPEALKPQKEQEREEKSRAE